MLPKCSWVWIMQSVFSLGVAVQGSSSHSGDGVYAAALQEDRAGMSAIGMREDADHAPVKPEAHSERIDGDHAPVKPEVHSERIDGDHAPVKPEEHSEGIASGFSWLQQGVLPSEPPSRAPKILIAWIDDVQANFAKFETMAAASIVAWTIVAIILGACLCSFLYLGYMAYYGTHPGEGANQDASLDTSRTATTALLEESSLPRPRDGQLPPGRTRRSQLPEGQLTPKKEEKRGSKLRPA